MVIEVETEAVVMKAVAMEAMTIESGTIEAGTIGSAVIGTAVIASIGAILAGRIGWMHRCCQTPCHRFA
ncbi:MAG: hypothetical protein ACKO8I_01250 [Cyanobacteriota bacterium]